MIDNTVLFNMIQYEEFAILFLSMRIVKYSSQIHYYSKNNSLEFKTETRSFIIIIQVNFFRVQVYSLLFCSTGKILLHVCCMITLFIHYSLTIFTQTSFTNNISIFGWLEIPYLFCLTN